MTGTDTKVTMDNKKGMVIMTREDMDNAAITAVNNKATGDNAEVLAVGDNTRVMVDSKVITVDMVSKAAGVDNKVTGVECKVVLVAGGQHWGYGGVQGGYGGYGQQGGYGRYGQGEDDYDEDYNLCPHRHAIAAQKRSTIGDYRQEEDDDDDYGIAGPLWRRKTTKVSMKTKTAIKAAAPDGPFRRGFGGVRHEQGNRM